MTWHGGPRHGGRPQDVRGEPDGIIQEAGEAFKCPEPEVTQQPIPRTLVGKLVAFARTGTAKALYERHHGRKDARKQDVPDNPLLFVPTHTARDLRKDLKAAGVPVVKPGEGKADFHSCRVAYVTFILEAGATVKEGQALARHATPDLTMNVYARARSERLAALAEKVGQTVLSEPKRVPAVSEGEEDTDGEDTNTLSDNELGAKEEWWRRRELNPRPECLPLELLRT